MKNRAQMKIIFEIRIDIKHIFPFNMLLYARGEFIDAIGNQIISTHADSMVSQRTIFSSPISD